MRKASQKGFTAIEGLLIVVILAIIGGTGYYVYHSRQAANNTLNSAQSESPSTSTIKKSTSTSSPVPTVKYISSLGGFSLLIPKTWFDTNWSDQTNLSEQGTFTDSADSSSVAIYSPEPSNGNPDACIHFYVLSNGQTTYKEPVNSGEAIADLGNGLKVYQIKETQSNKSYAELVLTNGGTGVMQLPNGNSLNLTAGYDCNQKSMDNLTLTYDQQIQTSEYKELIDIIKPFKLST